MTMSMNITVSPHYEPVNNIQITRYKSYLNLGLLSAYIFLQETQYDSSARISSYCTQPLILLYEFANNDNDVAKTVWSTFNNWTTTRRTRRKKWTTELQKYRGQPLAGIPCTIENRGRWTYVLYRSPGDRRPYCHVKNEKTVSNI